MPESIIKHDWCPGRNKRRIKPVWVIDVVVQNVQSETKLRWSVVRIEIH
jgi:hypothetical protein